MHRAATVFYENFTSTVSLLSLCYCKQRSTPLSPGWIQQSIRRNASLISLAALLMTDFRTAGKPCAKFVIFSKVVVLVDCNFRSSIEEYKTVDEVQEGFRPNRSTKRQVTK
jgi:hypothetical protein